MSAESISPSDAAILKRVVAIPTVINLEQLDILGATADCACMSAVSAKAGLRGLILNRLGRVLLAPVVDLQGWFGGIPNLGLIKYPEVDLCDPRFRPERGDKLLTTHCLECLGSCPIKAYNLKKNTNATQYYPELDPNSTIKTEGPSNLMRVFLHLAAQTPSFIEGVEL